jgi:hypothetical protein
MKKRDNLVDDEDDDGVRTSVLQDRVTATLCNFFSGIRIYIYLSLHIQTGKNVGGKDTDGQYDTFRGPGHSFMLHTGFLISKGFPTFIFRLRKTKKADFSIPGVTTIVD